MCKNRDKGHKEERPILRRLMKQFSFHLNISFQLVQLFCLSLSLSLRTCQTGDIYIKNIQILP